MKRWLFYGLYIAAAIVFFLYYLFPADAAKDLISAYLLKSYPAYRVSIEEIKPVFPPGIRLTTVGMAYQNQKLGQLDQLSIQPQYLALFSGNKRFNFRGTAYQGEIDGKLEVAGRAAPFDVNLNADLRNIRLDDIRKLQEVMGRKLQGRLNGNVYYQNGSGKDDTLEIRLNLADCTVEIAYPLLNIGIDALSFKSVDGVVVVDKQTLELKQCRAVGPQADGDLSGTIRFRRPFAKSLLDFRGSIQLHHSLLAALGDILPGGLIQTRKNDGSLPIKLYGTIENPKFSLR